MKSKKVTDGKVEGFYQLIAGDGAIGRVKSLTNEDQDYIYPINHVCDCQLCFIILTMS